MLAIGLLGASVPRSIGMAKDLQPAPTRSPAEKSWAAILVRHCFLPSTVKSDMGFLMVVNRIATRLFGHKTVVVHRKFWPCFA